jgi:hypothetical protein
MLNIFTFTFLLCVTLITVSVTAIFVGAVVAVIYKSYLNFKNGKNLW